MAEQLQSPPQSIHNFRDVGDFVNKATSTNALNLGQFYRSARPDEASTQERHNLVNKYKIKSIIDLRTKTELIQQSQKRNAKVSSSAAVPQSNSAVAEPLKIRGITYHEINFNGRSFSRMLISQLTWLEFFRLVGLMAIGYRLDAIKILSPHMEDMGLVGLATNSLDVCTREIKQIFDVLGDETQWPVMVHCTQGKDRTGLVVMLVLFLLGVEERVVDEDYRLSEAELQVEKEERLKELASIGLTENFAVCPGDVVSRVNLHLKEKYGGVEKYLKSVGVSDATIGFVKQKMSAKPL